MSNNKTLKVFSSTAVAGMIAAAMMSSQAFAAVDAYSVKVGDQVYKYEKAQLEKAFLDSKTGEKSALYEDFTKKLGEAKGFYAFNDTKNGYVDYSSIESKFLEAKGAGQKFDLDGFTESKDAKIVEVKAVKKAVVNKDGKVEYVTEGNKDDEKDDLKVTSVEPLSLKQVKINFNKAVTDEDKKDDIEDEDNYTLKDKDNSEIKNAIKEVKLDNDKKSATVTFNDITDSSYKGIKEYIIENQEKYNLVIDEDVTGEEVKEKIKFSDATLPEVKDISVVGVDTIKVKFSEPVMPSNIEKISEKLKSENKNLSPILDKDDFNIVDANNDDVNIRRVELVNDNKEANIVLSSDLKDKEKVSVKVKASVRDYAGLSVLESGSKTVEAKKDTKAPVVIGYKDVKDDKVTLVFDKDIKLKDSDSNEITSRDDLEKIYLTSDKNGNYAKEAKIDGKELTVTFEDNSLGNGTTNIYVKSGLIESRWEVENDKVSYPVIKNKDNTKPEIKRIEQDENANDKIKLKFSKKVKCNEDEKNKDENALNKSNYTLKDNDGREWSIKEIKRDGSDKEFVIRTVKDLDDDKEYTLEVKNIEDKDGNAIEKTKKKFKAVDNDSVKEEDVKVKAYSVGTSDQKIVVDFDSTMKFDDSKYSVNDLSKYTLVSTKKEFDGKNSINLSEVYRANKKKVRDGKAIEITIPGKESKKEGEKPNLHDKQFNLVAESGRYTLQIDRVSDSNGNVTDKNFEVAVTAFDKNTTGITFDSNEDYKPQINALDRISFSFNDKVNFDESDIKVVAAKTAEDAKKFAGIKEVDGKLKWIKDDMQFASSKEDKSVGEGVLETAKSTPSPNDDGNTKIDILMDKMYKDKAYDDDDNNHIFTYDGHFMKRDNKGKALTGDENKLNVYVVVVPSKGNVTETDNDYDQTVEWGNPQLVSDKLAPEIQDNNVRSKGEKYLDRNSNNDDKIVQYFYDEDANVGSIVLTFEENIAKNSIGTSSVELNKDDFKDAKVSNVKVDKNKVIIDVIDLVDTSKDKDNKDYKKKLEAGSRFTLKSLKDDNNNEASNLELEVGDFTGLKDTDPDVADTDVVKVAKLAKAIKALPKEITAETDLNAVDQALNAAKTQKNIDLTAYEKQVEEVKAAKDKLVKEAAEKKDNEESLKNLNTLIGEAEQLANAAKNEATLGKKVGSYSDENIATFKEAIKEAKSVAEKAENKKAEFDVAKDALSAKKKTFEGQVVKAVATKIKLTAAGSAKTISVPKDGTPATLQLTAEVTDQDGTKMPEAKVTFKVDSDDSSKVSVDEHGMISVKQNATAEKRTFTATCGSLNEEIQITLQA